MGNVDSTNIVKESPPIPLRDSIGYKNLQEKLKKLKEEMFENTIKEYEIVGDIENADNPQNQAAI